MVDEDEISLPHHDGPPPSSNRSGSASREASPASSVISDVTGGFVLPQDPTEEYPCVAYGRQVLFRYAALDRGLVELSIRLQENLGLWIAYYDAVGGTLRNFDRLRHEFNLDRQSHHLTELLHLISRRQLLSIVAGTLGHDLATGKLRLADGYDLAPHPGIYAVGFSVSGRDGGFLTGREMAALVEQLRQLARGTDVRAAFRKGQLGFTTMNAQQRVDLEAFMEIKDEVADLPQSEGTNVSAVAEMLEARPMPVLQTWQGEAQYKAGEVLVSVLALSPVQWAGLNITECGGSGLPPAALTLVPRELQGHIFCQFSFFTDNIAYTKRDLEKRRRLLAEVKDLKDRQRERSSLDMLRGAASRMRQCLDDGGLEKVKELGRQLERDVARATQLVQDLEEEEEFVDQLAAVWKEMAP